MRYSLQYSRINVCANQASSLRRIFLWINYKLSFLSNTLQSNSNPSRSIKLHEFARGMALVALMGLECGPLYVCTQIASRCWPKGKRAFLLGGGESLLRPAGFLRVCCAARETLGLKPPAALSPPAFVRP
jgi:hypothetical protein